MGVPLFDEFGDIAAEVKFPDLAAHLFFSETGVPIPQRAQSEFLGTQQGRAVYLLFDEAHAQRPREDSGKVLTPDRLAGLPSAPKGFEGIRVVYAEGGTVSADRPVFVVSVPFFFRSVASILQPCLRHLRRRKLAPTCMACPTGYGRGAAPTGL